MNVLMIGGSGFIGSAIAYKLVTAGHRITVATRSTERTKHLTTLPVCTVIKADVHSPAQLRALMAGHDAVINLVGILHGRSAGAGQRYGNDWANAHVTLPHNILEAMSAVGVKRYLHMSALGADVAGPSMYQRSKGDGEALVRASTHDWTIFQPSVVFGPSDKFLNTFAALQSVAPFVPLAGAGCKFQPVHVQDVAEAFVRSLKMPQTIRQHYALGGPEVFTLKDIVQLAGKKAGVPRWVFPVPEFVGRIQALALSLLPGEPLLSTDNLKSMHVDNIINAGQRTLTDLGIAPKMLSLSIDYLSPHAMRSPYGGMRARDTR